MGASYLFLIFVGVGGVVLLGLIVFVVVAGSRNRDE